MPNPSPKELKKLIKICRDLGVLKYSGEGYSFELTQEAPVKLTKSTRPTQVSAEAPIEIDAISQEALLFWSASELPNAEDKN